MRCAGLVFGHVHRGVAPGRGRCTLRRGKNRRGEHENHSEYGAEQSHAGNLRRQWRARKTGRWASARLRRNDAPVRVGEVALPHTP